MTEYIVYDGWRPIKMTGKSISDIRSKLMKKYSDVAYELMSFKIATKNDSSLGELRYDPKFKWKWVVIERKHAIILRHTNVYLVNKDGTLGKKLGNAYRV